MTSDEYAALANKRIASVVNATDDRWTPGAALLAAMVGDRITGPGAEYVVSDRVQLVEIKPVSELLTDIREEVSDEVAYVVALRHRHPELSADADTIISLSVQAMDCLTRMEKALAEVNA